jgi:hypothetical protein
MILSMAFRLKFLWQLLRGIVLFLAAYFASLIVFSAIFHAFDIRPAAIFFSAWILIGCAVCAFKPHMPPKPDFERLHILDAFKTLWWFTRWPNYLLSR